MTIEELIRFLNIETILPFIQFVLQHNVEVIEGLIAVILLTASFIAIRSFFISKEESVGGAIAGVSATQLEGMLKKAIEKAVPAQPSPAATAVPPTQTEPAVVAEQKSDSGTEAAALKEELNRVRQDLETKQAELEKIKNAPPPEAPVVAATGISEEEKSALEKKVSDLQKKLSEFDIISQDIADLSVFKEENQRLKTEVNLLKEGGAVALTEQAPVPNPAPTAESNVNLESEAQNIMETQASASMGSTVDNFVDDDIMTDFAKALTAKAPVLAQASKSEVDPRIEQMVNQVEPSNKLELDYDLVEQTQEIPQAEPMAIDPLLAESLEVAEVATPSEPELSYDLIEQPQEIPLVEPMAMDPLVEQSTVESLPVESLSDDSDPMAATMIPIPEMDITDAAEADLIIQELSNKLADSTPAPAIPIELSVASVEDEPSFVMPELPEIKMEELSADLEKMTFEASVLAEEVLEPTEDALSAELNAEKLAEEAEKLNDVKLGDPELMNEFEEFLKKGR